MNLLPKRKITEFMTKVLWVDFRTNNQRIYNAMRFDGLEVSSIEMVEIENI